MTEAAGRSTPASLGRRIVLRFAARRDAIPLGGDSENDGAAGGGRGPAEGESATELVRHFHQGVWHGRLQAAGPAGAFLTFPTERLYEYADVRADVVLECRLGEENVLVFAGLNHPESCPLSEIDRRLAACKQDPVGQVRRFRRALGLARLPRLVRRAVWWFLLNVSGRKRGRYFGTFGVTSVGNWGVESLRP